MWVVKTKGESFYVNHVDCSVSWSTKETPNNDHTKGSIKIKKCLLVIDKNNNAEISEISDEDYKKFENKKNPIRIITRFGHELKKFLNSINQNNIKTFSAACSTTWYVAEINSEKTLTLARLAVNDLRVLQPNEDYYKIYDKYHNDDIILDDIEDYYEE